MASTTSSRGCRRARRPGLRWRSSCSRTSLFRPLGPPRDAPGSRERAGGAGLVRDARPRHARLLQAPAATPTTYFSADRRAFPGYRVANRVLLVAGDPVGDPAAVPGSSATCAFAESPRAGVAALGASASLLPVYREAGMRALYIGDEAIVETRAFSLEGRAIRKIRQSVSRLESAGYTIEALDFERPRRADAARARAVSALWRDGAAERGFTMAMDWLDGEHGAGSVVIAARDGEGAIRGFLHFVPRTAGLRCRCRSCAATARRRTGSRSSSSSARSSSCATRGIEEVSLNFAAFGRWLGGPRADRARARPPRLARQPLLPDREPLRFSAKFEPRWEPRYLVFEGPLPRVALAALRIEGQLPKLRG